MEYMPLASTTQPVVQHVEHLDDAGRADVALRHARVEAVAPQVVQAVHVELPAHQLVQEAFGILVPEDAYGPATAVRPARG